MRFELAPALAELDAFVAEAAAELVDANWSESTRRAYRSALRGFAAWCEPRAHGKVRGQAGKPIARTSVCGECRNGIRDPFDVGSVVEYYVHRTKHLKRSSDSLRHFALAVSMLYRKRGLADPFASPAMIELRSGASRTANRARAVKQARALSLVEIRAMVFALQAEGDWKSTRDACALAFGWLGALRSEELCSLCASDVSVLEVVGDDGKAERVVELLVKASKVSDRPQKVALVQVFDLNPAELWEAWESTGKRRDERAFGMVTRWLGVRLVAAAKLAKVSRRGLSSHSLRAGVATAMVESAVPIAEIAQHGRWTSVDTVLRYVRRSERVMYLQNPLRRLR